MRARRREMPEAQGRAERRECKGKGGRAGGDIKQDLLVFFIHSINIY